VLTRLLIAANVLVFLWELTTGDTGDGRVLVRDGGLYGPYVAAGQWWRIFSAAFLHAGWLHIATNMFALYQVGTFVELLYGRVRMAIIYVLAIIGSGIAVYVFSYDAPTVGASGAIFGLFGALAAAGLRLGKPGRDLVQQSAGIIILNLVLGFTVFRFVSNAAHIGGLIAGALFGFMLYRVPQHIVASQAAAPVTVEDGQIYEAPEYVASAQEAPPRPAPPRPVPPVPPAHEPQG
jgi:rhomboid protease GluP